ncbi:MAG: 4Fe-4S dicluster domain-containing protein [Planctomycetes bacterium]|nr:4Fe-4S dicluster domain-containing protein [Planctomycetota bacterium]
MRPFVTPLVSTIKERCRVCYTCVRECPAKAIRIADRQAEIIPTRCIGCGNCVRVCSQRAKKVASGIEDVIALLRGPDRVAACLAPSFPAEFLRHDYETVVGSLRALGFDVVSEVAVGADLVAAEYARLLRDTTDTRYIATTCPAIVGYVERYYPELVPHLAPVVSPMIASARVLRSIHGDGLKIVFIGPCIAKKGEAASPLVAGEVSAVITFAELRDLLQREGVRLEDVKPSEFDPPHAGKGALFPISRGMLQAAGIGEDLLASKVVAAEGRNEFVEAVREFAAGDLEVRLLELLACTGCIMGPGMSSSTPLFRRRSRVSQYARQRLGTRGAPSLLDESKSLDAVDLERGFAACDQRLGRPPEEDVQEILRRMGKNGPEDELNCGACGYATCREHAVAISEGLAENEMCLPYTIEQLGRTCQDLTATNDRLASAQEALLQAEKLASMGQLAAGIAHEVNNPLSTVLMLAHVLLEEAREDSPAREDLALMASEADRCKKIVAGLLQFARKNKVETRRVDLRQLAYRIFRTLEAPSNIEVHVEQDDVDTSAEVDQDQIVQVLSNLASNAVDAMPQGGSLTIRVGGDIDFARIAVSDTGTGILEANRKKVFEPFFTTKEPGKGTGLGLAVTYGIVKMHNGDIQIQSSCDPSQGPTGTTFIIKLPRQRRPALPPTGSASDTGQLQPTSGELE